MSKGEGKSKMMRKAIKKISSLVDQEGKLRIGQWEKEKEWIRLTWGA